MDGYRSEAPVASEWDADAVVQHQCAVVAAEQQAVTFIFELRRGDQIAAGAGDEQRISEGEVVCAARLRLQW